ncbi:16S rRNA (guanine(966)-N(2))-methyltransferase RsmD [Actinotalea sp.]|uniref:16S rRNA (guanine(966)-N(2))-methyltransferase RsmD n=1 Tax=Actinotalea sp. TaxID=1872145 RepID=UPI003562BAFE
MTRIVAGTAGGRSLVVPSTGTRPTSDRVREALFSRLEHLGLLDGTAVLDLFAGSGALGLEAASRGAASVVLVDHAKAAVTALRRNVSALGLPGVSVVPERALPYLQRRRPEPALDLVLLDPPYELAEEDLAHVLTALHAHLAPEAVVVVERSARSPEPCWPDGDTALHRQEERRYGETVLWFAAP